VTAARLAAGQDERVRIGTWNLEGRWSGDHVALLLGQECDVWLLTEVRTDARLPGFESRRTTTRMGDRTHWAGIFSRSPLQPLPDPHPASAAAMGWGMVWCCSILPWRSCGTIPWGAGTTGEKTIRALDQLTASLPTGPLVWGGDWNHAMRGREYAGSLAGRTAIQSVLVERRLRLATEDQPHRIPGLDTIDHIAVPDGVQVLATHRVLAEDHSGGWLSDHDAYTTGISIP
jgi:hypothetical protein